MNKTTMLFSPFRLKWLAAILFVGALTFSVKSQIIITIAGTGAGGYNGDNIQATAAQLNWDEGVCIDAANNVLISDYTNERIRKITVGSGIITTIAGTGTAGYSGDGGQATAAKLQSPNGVSLDAAGNIYIDDWFNYRIRKINIGSGIITTIAGTGTAGYNGDNIQATAAEINFTEGQVAVDAAGNVYIPDFSNNRVRKVAAGSGIITTIAGTGTGGYSGDGGQATAAKIQLPWGITLDGAGNMFIGDCGNSRIRKVNLASGIITTVAGTGTSGYNGDNIQATAAELSNPLGTAVDPAGNLYIADANNNRIRKVATGTGIITTIAGTGTNGYNGDNIQATAAEIGGPEQVCLDAAGNIYIADLFNSRVRKIIMAVLPVQFLYLNCSSVNDGMELNWATATETNNKQFTLERSGDGVNFTFLCTVAGAGNSSKTQYYSYTDKNPGIGTNYYRLTQTDFDGKTTELGITSCDKEGSQFLVYPNPSQGDFTCTIPASSNSSTPSSLVVYDLTGRIVYSKTVQNQKAVELSLPFLAAGTYILHLEGTSYTTKLLITK